MKKLALFALLLLSATLAFYPLNFTIGPKTTLSIDSNYSNSEPNMLYYKDGLVYIADSGVPGIITYDPSENSFSKLGASLTGPYSLLFDSGGSMFVSDSGTMVRCWSCRPIYTSISDMDARGFTIHDKNFYIADTKYDRIVVLNDQGNFIRSLGRLGTYNGAFNQPQDLQIHNNTVYVADRANNRVEAFTTNLTYVASYGIGKGGVMLEDPIGIFADSTYLFVADYYGNKVVAYTYDGYPVLVYNISAPYDVLLAGNRLYVSQHDSGDLAFFNITIPNLTTETGAAISALSPQFGKYVSNAEVASALGIEFNATVVSEWKSANLAYEQKSYGYALYKALDLNASSDIAGLNSNLASALSSKLTSLAQNSTAKSEVLALIGQGNYAGAYAKLKSAPIAPPPQPPANTTNTTNTSQNTTPQVSINTTLLEGRLSAAEDTILIYHLNISTSEIEFLLDAAKANQSAYDSASLKLDALEQRIILEVYKIDAASAKIDELDRELSKKEYLVDYSKARAYSNNASRILYSDPEAAMALAERGLDELARARSSSSNSLGYIFIGVGLALLLAALAVFLLKDHLLALLSGKKYKYKRR